MESFESVEKTLGHMTVLVAVMVIFPRFLDVPARRNCIFNAKFGDILPDRSSSVYLIRKDVAAGDVCFLQQLHSDFSVIRLTARQDEIHDLPVTVDQSMDFCVLPTASSADILSVFRRYSLFCTRTLWDVF